MENILQIISANARQKTIAEGQNKIAIPYVTLYRYTQREIILPDTQNPFIYLVIDGAMRVHFGTEIRDYTPGQYLISAIDSPASALSLSPALPFLALSVEFTVDDVVSVMLDIDGDFPEKLFDTKACANIQLQDDTRLLETIFRLLDMSDRADELSFMGKHLKRELIFNLIAGLHGKAFIQSIVNIQKAGDIYNINSWIKQNFKDTFMVEELAEQSNMSLSSFHQKFKSAVGMGPLQCQKKLRLNEARRLMLDKAMSVTDTAMEVGYESVSQFIRDYGRMFGRSPQKDVQEIRDCFGAKTKSE